MWFKLGSSLSSGQVHSSGSGSGKLTWLSLKWRQLPGSELPQRAPGLHLSDLLSITNCLSFESMENDQNEKETQGATPVPNVLKLVFEKFYIFPNKFFFFRCLKDTGLIWRYYPPYWILNVIESGGDNWLRRKGARSLSQDDSGNWLFTH